VAGRVELVAVELADSNGAREDVKVAEPEPIEFELTVTAALGEGDTEAEAERESETLDEVGCVVCEAC